MGYAKVIDKQNRIAYVFGATPDDLHAAGIGPKLSNWMGTGRNAYLIQHWTIYSALPCSWHWGWLAVLEDRVSREGARDLGLIKLWGRLVWVASKRLPPMLTIRSTDNVRIRYCKFAHDPPRNLDA